jgi:hypothetical protein
MNGTSSALDTALVVEYFDSSGNSFKRESRNIELENARFSVVGMEKSLDDIVLAERGLQWTRDYFSSTEKISYDCICYTRAF